MLLITFASQEICPKKQRAGLLDLIVIKEAAFLPSSKDATSSRDG